MNYRIDFVGKDVMNNLSLKDWEITSFSFVHDCNHNGPNRDPETTLKITGSIFSDSNSIQNMVKDGINSFLNFNFSSLTSLSSLATFAGNLYNTNSLNTKKLFDWSKKWCGDDYLKDVKVTVKLSETNIRTYKFEKMECDYYQESFDVGGNGYFTMILKQSRFNTEKNSLEVNSFGL
ncbi:hypothetical protein [Sebaldella sp. S0638]|uniref:hypothetical protein n=1 Tax=Sebaldella sp. S0638 TaxID=2957809 RepID=UPI00209EE091|nr:hypothetical protein [Sebaldella sp. S0638]MCP1226248.1 hypothetical protein [Sebaldella sp. S0638]